MTGMNTTGAMAAVETIGKAKRQLLCAALAVGFTGVTGGYGLAKDEKPKDPAAALKEAARMEEHRTVAGASAPAAVEKALQRQYPHGSTFAFKAPHEVNGVSCYDVDVKLPAGGATMATVTEHGDFLISGVPVGQGGLPPVVKAEVEGLFKQVELNNVDRFVSTTYYVYIEPARAEKGEKGDRSIQLQLDATGRLIGMLDRRQLNDQGAKSVEEPAPPAVAEKITKEADRVYPGAKIEGVYAAEGAPGFFRAKLNDGGRQGFVTVDEKGNVSSDRLQLPGKDLPKPVLETVNSVFKGERIVNAERGEARFYYFEQVVGNETLSFKVRPTGEVMNISSDKPTAESEMPAVQQSGHHATRHNAAGHTVGRG